MRECPGTHCSCPDHYFYGEEPEETGHCPGCSSSQGDRLSESERGHVERIREMIVSGLGLVYPSSFDGKRLVEIIDRLAPRPGGSEG